MSANGFASRSNGCQLRVEALENRCLLAVMADGAADVDVRFADEELAICECAPAVLDDEYVTMVGDGSEVADEFAYEPGSNGDYEGELEQPYFVDAVMETTDESFIVCTLYDGPVDNEIFMTATGVDDGEWTCDEWVDDDVVTLGSEGGEVENWEEENISDVPEYWFTGVLDEAVEGQEYATEIIDVADGEAVEDSDAGAEGKGPLEWVDHEGSGPIIYTMMPEETEEDVRADDAELPVDEVAEDPVIITMMPEDSGEIVKGEDTDSSEGEVEDPVFHTMDDVDVVIDRETPAEPVSDDPEIVTFGNDGEAAENGPAVEVAEEVPVLPVNRPEQTGRWQRDGRNRGIMPLPMLPPNVDPPILAVVTRMDNRGRLREVQVELPSTDSQDAAERDLEPLDAAFSLMRGRRLNVRLGGLR